MIFAYSFTQLASKTALLHALAWSVDVGAQPPSAGRGYQGPTTNSSDEPPPAVEQGAAPVDASKEKDDVPSPDVGPSTGVPSAPAPAPAPAPATEDTSPFLAGGDDLGAEPVGKESSPFLESGGDLTAAPLEGGEMLDIAEFDLEQLLGNVSSVSRRKESLAKAPASVTILDRSDIRRSAARTIPDLLRMVPGVQVMQNAPGNYLVSLRGMGGLQGNNVVVLIDGVPMNSVVDGSVDWGNLPLHIDDIERIEVVRGPVSPIYGANAYAGVINLITSEPAAEGLWGSVRSSAGMDWRANHAQRTLAAVGGRNQWARWHMAADLSRNGVYLQGAESKQPRADKYSIIGKFDFSVTDNQTIEVRGGASRGQHSSLDQLVLESNAQRNDTAHGYIGYGIRDLPSVADSFNVWIYGRRFATETDASQYEGFSYDGLESADGIAGVQLAFDFPHEINWAIAGNGGVSHVDAPFLHPDENAKVRPRYGISTDASIDIRDRLYITGAVRADASAMMNRMQVSYRASASYYRDTYAIRLSGGSAFREPTFVEVGGRFSDPESNLILLEGTAGLRSPRVDSVELGGLFLAGHTFTVRPTIYFAYMRELMVADFEPLVRKSFRNDSKDRPLLGGEFEASWQFIPSMNWKTTGGVLVWLKKVDDLSATVAVPEQNAVFSMWSGFHGAWIDDRLSVALGVGYMTPRRYRVRAGIPPEIVGGDLSYLVRPESVIEYRFLRNQPFWIWLRGSTVLPHQVESPLPGASQLGTAVFAGIGYRG